ncbi:Spy/CpxP family protein refolding chaperone [Usitatibacter palustris]|uniref:Periplasmic heavy metal sensor n=1 Tax=Usitatibacter palustris TaxID=2732487 RepID=A0A6M4H5B0_9PROT|nr:periplasmic heavy metal sensor [Usitatibacter palustris]QJR14841.1 hypothetical protein DSM104440_01654 [Usitatibacter palustris]
MLLRPFSFALMLWVAGCATSPYVGQEARTIKTLSEKETADLLAGAGMGLAKAAELNGYPGPMHVLELSSQLALSPSQLSAVEATLKTHKAEARALGMEVVTLEQELNRLFANKQASAAQVDALTERLAAASGRLRASHLKAHVTITSVLTPEQVAKYAELRGYSGAGKSGHHS